MAVHPEDANIMLASQGHKIAFLIYHEAIPQRYARRFDELVEKIDYWSMTLNRDKIYKFPYMHKTTAAKNIKLLLDIYDCL